MRSDNAEHHAIELVKLLIQQGVYNGKGNGIAPAILYDIKALTDGLAQDLTISTK